MAEITLTYALRLLPNPHQAQLMELTCERFLASCNLVSAWCRSNKCLTQKLVRKHTYTVLRECFGLGAQMAQSAIGRVIANYKTVKENLGSPWGTKKALEYTSDGYDLVYNRDYSFSGNKQTMSLTTIEGRIKLSVDWSHVPKDFHDGKYGTCRLLKRNGKWLLLMPITIQINDPRRPQNVMGIDLGMRFLAATYDSDGKSTFHRGKEVTRKRAHYKQLRTDLQKKHTRSARKRIKSIGNRENRWMTDINHQVSKALVAQCHEPTLFVLEDLTGIRHATEKVGREQRYTQVSWAFFQLRTFIEYKAKQAGHTTLIVDPRYTSQTCPRCGLIRKANRDKTKHEYKCANCGYRSNDDRVAAMNLHLLGYLELMQTQPDNV